MNRKFSLCIGIFFILLQIIQEAYSEECKCGKAVGGKVVGGEKADVRNYPWLLALHKQDEKSDRWAKHCSATLIHPEWAITAGHCVKNAPKDGLVDKGKCYDKTGKIVKCFLPPNKLQLALAISQGRKRELSVSQVIPHPSYNPTKVTEHDIALLKLDDKVTCSRVLTLVCVSEGAHMDYPKSPVIMAGWGLTKGVGGKSSPELKQTKLKVESQEKCSASTNIDGVLCTNGGSFGGTPCMGDSGGPLMYIKDEINYITGVLSHGTADCNMTGQAKFTKLTDHMKWIRRHVPLDEVKKYAKDKDYE